MVILMPETIGETTTTNRSPAHLSFTAAVVPVVVGGDAPQNLMADAEQRRQKFLLISRRTTTTVFAQHHHDEKVVDGLLPVAAAKQVRRQFSCQQHYQMPATESRSILSPMETHFEWSSNNSSRNKKGSVLLLTPDDDTLNGRAAATAKGTNKVRLKIVW